MKKILIDTDCGVDDALDSKVALTVVTWDAAVKTVYSEAEIRALGLERSRAGRLPDPLTMAYAIDPDLARQNRISGLRPELGDSAHRGASVR